MRVNLHPKNNASPQKITCKTNASHAAAVSGITSSVTVSIAMGDESMTINEACEPTHKAIDVVSTPNWLQPEVVTNERSIGSMVEMPNATDSASKTAPPTRATAT